MRSRFSFTLAGTATRTAAGAMLALTALACEPVQQSVQTMAKSPTATKSAFYHMGDNGRSHNLAIADVHFVPHTSEISGLGEKALERFAPWLATYGGTLRYETYLTDEVLVVKRIAHVREYLGLVGCDVDRINVTARISGGRKITAADAFKIKKASSGATSGGAPLAGPGGAMMSNR